MNVKVLHQIRRHICRKERGQRGAKVDILNSQMQQRQQDAHRLLSAADRQAVGQAVVDAANARKAGAAFRLSDETRETGGGLVLRRGKVELNCGFTEKLRRLRQEESSAVAKLLFD